MKFQLKALAAALALVAVAVPAQAAVDTNASGNGSFILTVLDKVANVSATFDLGKNYFDFNQSAAAGAVSSVTDSGTSFSWDLNSSNYSSAWTSFLSVANLANTTYAITAGDNNGFGSTAAGSRGYITTYVSAGTGTTTNLLTALANMDLYVANTGVVAGSTLNSAADGAAFTTPATGYYAANKNFGTGVVTVGAIGTSLGVAQTLSTAANLSQATTNIFGNGAQFTLATNGALSYTTNPIVTAPVPEADTWAMMMVGLGLMGFMARRRNRNQA
jgi:hypothetical protein